LQQLGYINCYEVICTYILTEQIIGYNEIFVFSAFIKYPGSK